VQMIRIENPSLNLHLLCLVPKYLDLIFVGFVLWAILEVWMCMNELRNNMVFGPSLGLGLRLSPCLALDHGPHHIMLPNRPKTCKHEVPPKYMCKREYDQY
jgi:hypothetical protein